MSMDTNQPLNSEENGQDMAQALEEFENEKNVKVYVDVGYKVDGFIPANQVSSVPDVSPSDVVKVGDVINVMVQKVGDGDGDGANLLLSKRRADSETAWRTIVNAKEKDEVITATCTEQVKGGLIVDVGLRGFVPASHVALRPVKDLSEFVGEALPLKVLEVDRSRRKVVLSRKNALQEEREKAKEETMNKLQEGSVVSGTVARLTDFGAFINLGGVDGLAHISELSWSRIKQPSDVVQPGQKVDVLVLKVDNEKNRISLSLRQAAPDPWMMACDKYKVGDTVKGRITRLAPKYAFIEVVPGFEGLIPVGEMDRNHVNKPADVLKVDQEVEAEVIDLNRDQRRMTLSIKRLQQEKVRANESNNNSNNGNNGNAGRIRHKESGGGTIAEQLAAKLGGEDKVKDMLKGDVAEK